MVGWRVDDTAAAELLGRGVDDERSSERGAGGLHRVRERLWGGGCVVRPSGHVERLGKRGAEGRASCCWGVGEQGWRVDDLLSYPLLGRCEVHERSSERGAGGWHRVRERLWGCGCVVRSSGQAWGRVCGAEGGRRPCCVIVLLGRGPAGVAGGGVGREREWGGMGVW